MTLTLEILVPDGVVMRSPASIVQAMDASGSFGLLPGHAHFAAVDGGVLLLEQGRVSVVTQDAVVADQLEQVVDAVAKMLAMRQGQERAARTAFADLVASLLREIPRAELRR